MIEASFGRRYHNVEARYQIYLNKRDIRNSTITPIQFVDARTLREILTTGGVAIANQTKEIEKEEEDQGTKIETNAMSEKNDVVMSDAIHMNSIQKQSSPLPSSSSSIASSSSSLSSSTSSVQDTTMNTSLNTNDDAMPLRQFYKGEKVTLWITPIDNDNSKEMKKIPSDAELTTLYADRETKHFKQQTKRNQEMTRRFVYHISNSTNTVIFTGAGISTGKGAGLKTIRGSTGLTSDDRRSQEDVFAR